ncbi:MAG: chromosome segregation protein SMC, partial [Saprospiraceae bacterium]
ILPTDYGSVSVSRILYRSGESEYRLNGVTCRLKDITSLFLDTGIGPDSYAIIALNMVEDLLSDREQARRKMFEQAAGISKYKARKHETQQKLEATAADLDRVEDLLFEIEDQLKKLEKQAQRTQKYYELKDEYRAASIELAVFNLAKHKKSFKDLKEQIAAQEDAYRAVEAQGRLIEADLEAKRKSHTDKETKLSDSQQQVNQLAGRIRGRENEKSMLAQRLNYLRNDLVKLQTTLHANAEQLRALESGIEAYQTEMNYEVKLETEADELLNQRRQALEEARARHGALKGDLDQFVQAQQAVERALVELEKQKAVKNAQTENLRRDMQRTLNDIADRKSEMNELLVKLSDKEREAGQKQAQLARAESDDAERRAELGRTESEIETLQKRTADHRRALDARQNEFKLTKSMVENLEGFPESIRFLSQQKDWAQRCPLLSDLLFVQEDYRVTVENYLEPYLNYYVAPTVSDAAAAIQLLHSSQKGRANFFILELIDRNPPELRLLPGSLAAMDVVSADPTYRHLVSFLLGNVVIVDEASPLSSPAPDVIYLQKNGGFVQRRFSLAGGSVGLFEGKKIGRKKNLELLETEIKKLEKIDDDLRQRLEALKARAEQLRKADQNAAINELRRQLNQAQQEKAALQARIENIAVFVDNFDKQAAESGALANRLDAEIAEIQQALRLKSAEAEQLRSQLDQADGSFREVADALNTASQAYNETQIAFIRQQNKVNVLRQELNFKLNRREEINQAQIALTRTLQANEQETAQAEQELRELEAWLQQSYHEKKAMESKLGEAEQVYVKARNEIMELENRSRENFR